MDEHTQEPAGGATFADPPVELREVENLRKEVERAQEHDKPARAQYAIDRRYAAGTADIDWAVNTNLIGNYIDILVDYLYAKNPDVSARPAEEVSSAMPAPKSPNLDDPMVQEEIAAWHQIPEVLRNQEGMPESVRQMEAFQEHQEQQRAARRKRAERQDFASTIEIVVSKLWKRGKLKKHARKQVRSCLSVGPGWLKVAMLSDTKTDPEVQAALNDLRDNLERVQALQREVAAGNPWESPDADTNGAQAPEDLELKQRELQEQIAGMEPTLEVVLRKGLAIDYVSAEDMIVSTDVRYIDDYLDAGFCGNQIYVRTDEIAAKFPRLTAEDISQATKYYMRSPLDAIRPKEGVDVQQSYDSGRNADAADQFVSEKSFTGSGSADQQQVSFAKVAEIWDRNSNHIKTMVEGVKRWAKEPFKPKYGTTRFFPYFYLAFYEVDGARHSQSLSGRMCKLQDEYADTRSKYRLARSRATPGTIANAEMVSREDAKKVATSTEQEVVMVRLTNPNMRLGDVFAPKPVSAVDASLYDTRAIVTDMEKLSGVQEAKQTRGNRPAGMTATEAEIEESGFAARASADQDSIDEMLTDLAQYTAELSLQALTHEEVVKMAGVQAYWPEGLPIEEITNLVEVDIEAGSTGRPNRSSEQQAWTMIHPMIRQDIIEIQQARAMGNTALADALIELLNETMRQFGMRGDVERFIPAGDAPMPMPMPGDVAPPPVDAGVPDAGVSEVA